MPFMAEILYSADINGVNASPAAPHVDYWSLSPDLGSTPDAIRARNANTKILMYASMAWTRSSTNQAVNDSLSIDYATANAHENWFLHSTAAGNPRLAPDSYSNYRLNPRAAPWNSPMDNSFCDAVIAHITDAFFNRNPGLDGIFMDGVTTSYRIGIGSSAEFLNDTTTSYPTNWQQYALIPFMTRLIAGLKANGIPMLVGNTGFDYSYGAYVDANFIHRCARDLINTCGIDGYMEESFTDGGVGPAQQGDPTYGGTGGPYWFKGKFNTQRYAAVNNKFGWNHTKGASTQQVARYALGMTLMCVNADPASNSCHALHDVSYAGVSGGNKPWWPEYDSALRLGAPNADAVGPRADGTYFRQFANGSVTVNGSSVTASGVQPWDAQITLSAPSQSAPVNTGLPSISGQPSIGSVLTCNDGTWTGSPSPTFARQWKRNGVNIVGATGTTYTIVAGDVGTALTVTVTATNSAGSASATSAGLTIPSAAAVFKEIRRIAVGSDENILPSELPAEVPARLLLAGDMTAITNQAALQDIPALQAQLGAARSEIWDLTWTLTLTAANTAMGVKLGLALPAGATARWGPTSGAVGWNAGLLSDQTQQVSLPSVAGTMGLVIRALVFGGGTAGAIRLQYAQSAANAGALQVKGGSVATYTRLQQ